MNKYIANKNAETQDISLEMETDSRFIEYKNIKEVVLGSKSISFINYAEKVIEKYKLINTFGTYNRYMTTISKIKAYINGYDLTFNEITPVFLNDYEHYLQKAEKKGRTKAELNEIIFWLTGYNEQTLQKQIENKTNFETLFTQAPRINPNASKIKGIICGYRFEEIEDPLVQKVLYLD